MPDQTLNLAFSAILILIAFSSLVYYVRQAREGLKNPKARTPVQLFKRFFWGNPLRLVAILVSIVVVLLLVNYFTTGHFLR